jgi:hypothetical protein
MSSASRLLAIGLAAACLAAALAPSAVADGDPASDYLLGVDVFALGPSGSPSNSPSVQQLRTLVRDAKKRGFRIKVALIERPSDLGAVTPLWLRPQLYARFLGQEIAFVYKGRLLTVMPNGYGVASHGKVLSRERKALGAAPPPSSTGTDLAPAASRAVIQLAGQSGIELTLPPPPKPRPPPESNQTRYIIVIALCAVAVLALAFARRPRRGVEREKE